MHGGKPVLVRKEPCPSFCDIMSRTELVRCLNYSEYGRGSKGSCVFYSKFSQDKILKYDR